MVPTNRNICALGALALTLMPQLAIGQSSIEHHVWQDKRQFQPYSRTAQAVTGPISLSGSAAFAAQGTKTTIAFGNRKAIGLVSVGASWRQWSLASDRKVTAEVFKIARDPGFLLNGNTVCGDPKKNSARYIVFFEDASMGDPVLDVAIFGSETPPFDINSKGLCGTFNYEITR